MEALGPCAKKGLILKADEVTARCFHVAPLNVIDIRPEIFHQGITQGLVNQLLNDTGPILIQRRQDGFQSIVHGYMLKFRHLAFR